MYGMNREVRKIDGVLCCAALRALDEGMSGVKVSFRV